MKKRIFIRIICLLLCISMLMPVTAAAATPIYTYPSVKFRLTDGETTDEMAYVDEFYNADGSFSTMGDRLIKWLDMSERAEGSDRTNSGYLMLEQEMHHQDTSFMYWKGGVLAGKIVLPIAELISSCGLNLVVKLMTESAFNDKFGWAGESAYPYYQQLSQLYYQYTSDLQTQLQLAEEMFEKAAEGFDYAAQLSGENYLIKPKVDAWIFTTNKKGGGITYKVLEVKNLEKGEMLVQNAGKTQVLTISELVQGKNNANITVDLVGLTETDLSNLNKKLESMVKVSKKGNESLFGLPYTHVAGYFDSLQETGLNRDGRNALRNVDQVPKDEYKVPKGLETAGKIGEYASVGLGLLRAIMNDSALTAQQASYLSVLMDVNQDYLDMLSLWYENVGISDVEGKADIQAALGAMIQDILEMRNKSLEKLEAAADEDGGIFASGDYAESIVDIAQLVFQIEGFANLLKSSKIAKTVKDTASKVSTALPVNMTTMVTGAGLVSVIFGIVGSSFMEFDQVSQTVTDLKKSLYYFLADETDGLLYRYPEERTHANARAIINALNTMKSAKILGETVWEEYYLRDYYEDLDMEVGSEVHLIVRNELMNWNGTTTLDITPHATQVVGVYQDTYQEKTREYIDMDMGERRSYPVYDVHTKALGYYLMSGTQEATYNGVELTRFTAEFSNLPNREKLYQLIIVDSKTLDATPSDEWMNGDPVKGTDRTKMSKDDKLMLYSHNGVEMIIPLESYRQCREILQKINALFRKYQGAASKIDYQEWGSDKEFQDVARLEWTILTRRWIESMKMFAAPNSKDD